MVSFLFLGMYIKNTFVVALLTFVHQICVAMRDVLAEGLMVVISRKEDLKSGGKETSSQKYVSIIFMLKFIGTLFSSYIAGLLLSRFDPHQILLMCAVFPLLSMVQALFFF